jgi:Right handed beta helix region
MQRKIYFILLLLFACSGFIQATNYYFSSVKGDDANSGLTPDDPKGSLYQIQQAISAAEPGDTIFLERGSLWYETSLYASGKLGTRENPIVFAAYGTGDNPVLSGQKILEDPERNGNIYTFHDMALPNPLLIEKSYGRRFLGYVTIGTKAYPPSRHPDTGFFQSTSSNRLFLTDTNKDWEPNQWKDGWISVKKVKWQWSTARILSNDAQTIDYTEHVPYTPSGKLYYSIINAYDAMNRNGEWYWTNDSLSIYWDQGALPVVKASTKNEILKILSSDYLHFYDIDFVGANTECVKITKGDYNKFDHCRFIGAGEYGFQIVGQPSHPPAPGDSENNMVINSEIADCGLGGLFTRYARGGYFANNHIHRICLHPGYSNKYANSDVDGYAMAVWNNLELKLVVKQNLIDSVSAGISSHYNNDTLWIRENLVRNYGMGELSDMGGVYIVTDNLSISTKKNINKNFFLDVHAPLESQYNTYGDSFIHAVYADQDTYGVKADSNSIENSDIAFKTNGGKGRTFSYNNVLHPVSNMDLTGDRGAIAHHYIIDLMNQTLSESDTLIHNNVVFGPGGEFGYQFARNTSSYDGQLGWKGEIDYNRWFDPSGTSPTVAKINASYSVEQSFTFPEWQAFSDTIYEVVNDPGKNSLYDDTLYEEVILLKNWSAEDQRFPLTADYVDVDKNPVSVSVTVPAFYSKLLFRESGEEAESDMYFDSTLVPMYGNSFEFGLEQMPFYGDVIAKLNFTTSKSDNETGWTRVDEATNFPLSLGGQVQFDMTTGLLEGDQGLTESILPPEVGSTYAYLEDTEDTPVTIVISGLDSEEKYSVKFFSSCSSQHSTEGAATIFSTETDSLRIQHGGNASYMGEMAYLSPDQDGEITVTMEKTHGDEGFLNALVINKEMKVTVGVSETNQIVSIRCYPVPVSDRLYMEGIPSESLILAYDIRGSRVLELRNRESDSMQADMTGLPAGIYLFQVIAPDGSHSTIKVVKRINR